MSHFDHSPRPRRALQHVPRFHYPSGSKTYLPDVSRPSINFWEVLGRRRSRRRFARLDLATLSSVLWSAGRSKGSTASGDPFLFAQRPYPSAGSLYPIDLLVFSPDHGGGERYDPVAHALVDLELPAPEIERFLAVVEESLPLGNATLIWLVADVQVVRARYHHHETLVWREAGAVLATLGLVAEAHGLNHCMLGMTGEPWVSAFFGRVDSDGPVGVGGILLGHTAE